MTANTAAPSTDANSCHAKKSLTLGVPSTSANAAPPHRKVASSALPMLAGTWLWHWILPSWQVLARHWMRILPVALGYGVFIWLMMNFAVIPMSRIGPIPIRPTAPTVAMVLIHMFVIGLPIAHFASTASRRG